jgi:hypothetical protein
MTVRSRSIFTGGCLLAGASLLLGACGGSTPTGKAPAARTVLAADVTQLGRYAQAHDEAAARRELSKLRDDVSRLEAEGRLSAADGLQVLAAAARVQSELYLLTRVKHRGTTTTTTTTTTTAVPPTTAPPPPPPPPPKHKHHKPGGGPGGGGGDGGQGGDAGWRAPRAAGLPET